MPRRSRNGPKRRSADRSWESRMATHGPSDSSDEDREITHAGSRLGTAEFGLLRRLIHREAGICLNEGKREMICARLGKRLRELGLGDYRQYCEYLSRRDP